MHCSRVILTSLVILTLALPTASFSQQVYPGGQTQETIQAPPPTETQTPAYQTPAPTTQSPAYQTSPPATQSPAYQAPPPATQSPAYQAPAPVRPEAVTPPADPAPAPDQKQQKPARKGSAKDRESRSTRVQASTGTVRMALAQGAFLLSASGGQGTLSYRGKKYPFRIGGGGIGAIGFSRADVVGTVENLSKIEDFPGAYLQGRVGYAAGTGVSRMRLENTRGVVLRLRSVTKGLALNLGGEGLLIELVDPGQRP